MENPIKKTALAAGVTTALLLSGFALAQTPNYERASKYLQQVQQLRQQAQDQVKQAKENVLGRIRQIKDQRKQDSAKKIADQFDKINQVWTDHFTNVLDRLEDVVKRIETKAQFLESRGEDTALVKAELSSAKEKISAARQAIMDQAKKTYVVDAGAVTGDGSTTAGQNSLISQLRVQFKTVKDKLFLDLFALRDGAMKEAR